MREKEITPKDPRVDEVKGGDEEQEAERKSARKTSAASGRSRKTSAFRGG